MGIFEKYLACMGEREALTAFFPCLCFHGIGTGIAGTICSLPPRDSYPDGGAGGQCLVPCSCVGDQTELLAALPAARTARLMGVRIKKMFVAVGADPWEVRSPTELDHSGMSRRAQRRGCWSIQRVGTGGLPGSVQSIAGCRMNFAAPPLWRGTAPDAWPGETPR